MNINHASSEVVTGDRFDAIFNRQRELMEKYHDIEMKNGMRPTGDIPVDLDDPKGQTVIKDFCWRITEEVGEALDAKGFDENHFVEELIDALHFLTELTITAGYDTDFIVEGLSTNKDLPDKLSRWIHARRPRIDYRNSDEITVKNEYNMYQDFMMNLGMMANCLKNKPWKQSHMKTDKAEFEKWLKRVWLTMGDLLFFDGDLMPDEVVDIYLKKSQVNQFRQRSNY